MFYFFIMERVEKLTAQRSWRWVLFKPFSLYSFSKSSSATAMHKKRRVNKKWEKKQWKYKGVDC